MEEPIDPPAPGRWPSEFEPPTETQPEPSPDQPRPRRRRRYGTRKCRICLGEVEPTFDTGVAGVAGSFIRGGSKPRYIDEDPDLGRLMSPCMCKGSQKYVHEGCLESWRQASRASRNMWQCPTCNFQYRMDRLSFGKILSHWGTNLAITLLIIVAITFLLGFIGDKVVDFYMDPWGFLFNSRDEPPPIKYYRTKEDLEFDLALKRLEATWGFHFLKGFFSLGVIGFLKAALASPFYYFNLGGRRRRGDGRDRYMDLSWTVIIIGTATFIWAVWRGVRSVTERALTRVKENIVDVQGEDDDEEWEEIDPTTAPQGSRPAEPRKDQ